jgi:hypothetical protein
VTFMPYDRLMMDPGVAFGGIDPSTGLQFQNAGEADVDIRFGGLGARSQAQASGGAPDMGYYSGGFLPAGAGQTASLSQVLLGGLTTGINTILPRIFGGGGGGLTRQPPPGSASRPPSDVTGAPVSIKGPAEVMGAGAAAGGLIEMLGGHGGHARYAPAGTKGYHMIRRGPHAGQWTRNRHRNVANIRALRRAMSRLHGFERVCRKVVHFVSPHKRGRPVFRKRRKRS